MDRDLNQFVPREGMNVYGSDGDKVGEVDAIEQDYFVVRKGFFFPEDHYIPLNAVNNYDDENIYLAYTKDQVLEQQWTSAPDTTVDPATTGNYNAADAGTVDTTARTGDEWVEGTDTVVDETVDRGAAAADVTDRDDTTINVHEEELVANRREVERGAVRIEKDVVSEEQSIDVPVTEEQVEVTRRTVDRDAAVGDHAFEEGTIEVPLRGEEVEVEKRARVVEEIDVDKTAETHTERVTDTVRREEVHVEGENVNTDVDTDIDRRR